MPFSLDGLPIVGRISINDRPNRYKYGDTDNITVVEMLKENYDYY